MEAKEKVKIRSLEPYRHLFPPALAVDKTIKKGASVQDTVYMIPQVIKKCTWQVQKYVDAELKGLSTYDVCKKLWDFVKYHIEYRPDARGIEQVRSPRRLIHDGYGDCDCGTTFIASCLYALRIPVILRITKYKEDRFQHIYPVVPMQNGTEIIVDFVVPRFNYEEPYSEKKDFKMDLQFLDGIEDKSSLYGVDAQDLYGNLGDFGELGQLLRKAKSGKSGGIFKKKTPQQKQQKKEERKKKLLKVVNKVNKVNAGAALLRAGILASMKLNLMKVAERLKWGYATRELAQSKGMDMSKYDRLKQVLAKTEKIFYTAGGKPENLRKAILTGRGNRNHEVSGVDGYSETTPLNELLGAIYQDEFVNGIEGLEGNGLGVVTAAATTASITAATGTMAAIAGLLKQIGALFPKKEGSKQEGKQKKGLFKRKNTSETEEQNQEESSETSESSESSDSNSETSEENSQEENNSDENTDGSEDESENNLPATNDEKLPTTTDDEEEKQDSGDEEGANGLLGLGGIKDFYQKNKKWIVPVGIAATAVTLGLVINHYASKPQSQPKPEPRQEQTQAVNGVKTRNRRRKNGEGRNHGRQSVIALM